MNIDFQTAVRELPPKYQNNVITPYVMPLVTSAFLDGGGSVDLTIPTQNVLSFALLGLIGRVWADGAPQTAISSPAMRVNVMFSSGQNLTNGNVLWDSVITAAQSNNPGFNGLPAVWLIPGTTTCTITLTSFAAVGTHYWAEIDLVGLNVWDLLRPEFQGA